MRDNFAEAVELTFIFEGIHNVDTGGDTKFGIARKFHPEITDEQWMNFTKDDAEQIYLFKYWIPAGCNALPRPLDIVAFDAAVNPGPGEVKILLSQCNGNVGMLIDLREAYYRHLAQVHPDKFAKYLAGWLNRCETLRKRFVIGGTA